MFHWLIYVRCRAKIWSDLPVNTSKLTDIICNIYIVDTREILSDLDVSVDSDAHPCPKLSPALPAGARPCRARCRGLPPSLQAKSASSTERAAASFRCLVACSTPPRRESAALQLGRLSSSWCAQSTCLHAPGVSAPLHCPSVTSPPLYCCAVGFYLSRNRGGGNGQQLAQ